jgi:hypothetical protein
MLVADPTTIPVGAAVTQVCPALGPGTTVVLWNGDLTNVAYAGYRNNLAPGNAVPIQPLASVTLDASRSLYAFCPTATVQLSVAPGGTNIQPSPAQIAAQIAASGLMLNTTGQAINGTLGQPAQDPSITTGLYSAVPQLIADEGNVAANTAWGPFTVTFPRGSAYELVLLNVTGGDAFITDVTVQHLDANNNVVFQEDFTVGNFPGTGSVVTPGVTIRGNLHGPKLKISGLSCAQAFITALSVGFAPLAGPFHLLVYSQPQPVAETLPKAVPWDNPGFLAAAETAPVAASGGTNVVLMPSYTGKAFMNFESQTGGGFNAFPFVSSYSVANGSGSRLYAIRFAAVGGAGITSNPVEFALDGRLHLLTVFNLSAVAGNASVNVVPENYI